MLQPERFLVESVLVDPSEASDAALVAATRRGDVDAARVLRARHQDAVQVLADIVTPAALVHAWDTLVADLRAGKALEHPLRLAWILGTLKSDHTTSHTPSRAPIWAAFSSLPVAWQTALWHHVVEGDDEQSIARLTGIDPLGAKRAVQAGWGTLRRVTARGHASGDSADCLRIAAHVRSDVTTTLETAFIRKVREHARSCDDCLPLTRDMFQVEFTLADVLATCVLGSHASEYLRTRRRGAQLSSNRLPRTALHVARRTRGPLIGVTSTGLAAAAVAAAFVVQTPGLGGSQADPLGEAPRAAILQSPSFVLQDVDGSGATSIRLASSTTGTTTAQAQQAAVGPDGQGSTAPPGDTPVTDPGDLPEGSTDVPVEGGPGEDGSGSSEPDPVDPRDPGGPDEGSDPDGGTGNPPPLLPDTSPVQVQVDEDRVEVVVNVPAPGVDPIEVTLPEPPLPDLPLPAPVGGPLEGGLGGLGGNGGAGEG
ncbi:hypothetical protein [Nocardioides sp.]|uniref:hypothetical protein n=1 Tax=Nocardioides sp. TaxID=35761 RepID=UPI00286D0E26|nr:hypothetical protein [Nocardioides sp.]